MLGVMPTKYINGCNSLQGDANLAHFTNNCQDVMSLEDMLTRQFGTDAHFTCYNLTSFPQWPLLNKSILPEIREEELDIVLAYMAFDWDNPNHGNWTKELEDSFAGLLIGTQDPIIGSWTALYTTQHGARLIYKLSSPVPVDVAEQHLAWMIKHFHDNGFSAASGIGHMDESCKDWTRRMRCPQVMRDDVLESEKCSWRQPYYSIATQDKILDINLVGKRSAKSIARKTYFVKDKQDLPSFDELEKQLKAKSTQTGKFKLTEFHKKAKKALKDSAYLDILFNDAAPVWDAGHRNDEIGKMLGYITPVLLKWCFASVQQVFSLAVNPLLTLDNDQDWIKHGWNALLDIYEREVNKLNLEREHLADQASKEEDTLDGMVEGMKEWCSASDLHKDDDAAREFVRANCLASVQGGYLYTLDKQGRYSDFAVHKDQVISRIRKTFLGDVVKTTKINFQGEEVDVTVSAVVNNHSTPVSEVQMKPVGGEGGYIEHINGDRPVLVLSTFCRNDNLMPEFNSFVDGWLENLFGMEHYEKGCTWIGNALAFEEGLICALSMEGASAAGKKLLTEGLSECLKTPYTAGPEAMYQQSSAFLKTPFLVINEAWPNIRGETSPADKFKSLTGGDGIIVNEKFKPSMRVLCPVRLIMTANDDGIIKELVKGKDMCLENRIAVGERLFHLTVSKKAKIYLESIGGRGFTAKHGQRWIRPDSGSDSSDFVVAKHFLWLYHNRDTVDTSQRFLVMGNCAPGEGAGQQNVLEKLLADNNDTPIVARAIIEMVDNKSPVFNKFVRVNATVSRLWVTRFGVHKYVKEVMEERSSEKDVFSGMLNILEKSEPDLFDNAHWYEISVEALVMIATERGIAQTLVRNIYMNKIQLEQEQAVAV